MFRFDFNAKMDRTSYLGYTILDFIGLAFLYYKFEAAKTEAEMIVLGLIIFLVLVVNFILQIQRLNSIGANRFWSLVYLIPVLCAIFIIPMFFARPASMFERKSTIAPEEYIT